MKNKLTKAIMIAALSASFAATASPIINPEPGKYYRVRHVSGKYLTDGGFNSRICNRTEDNTQIVRFIPVEGKEGVYNIQRVSSGMHCGTDNRWTSTAISRNVPQSQYRIAVSGNPEYVVLMSESMANGKNCMGTDQTTDGSEVYTDKDGKDTGKHLWAIEEAEPYPVNVETPADCYPGKDLPDDDPRKNAYEGYKLVFAQEFSDGNPGHDVWDFEEGFCRNQEDQWYNGDRNIYVQDGVLVIEGRNVENEHIRNPRYENGNHNWPSSIGEYLTWTSGSMKTKGSKDGGYTWLYGIYEVRAKVPQYVGAWPAIWSTGIEHEWPYGGEIDIMEYYGNCIHGNVCWGNGNRWSGYWNSATVHDSQLGAGWGDEYHIWRMVWDYEHMELWCDDILVNNIDLSTTYNAIPNEFYDHGNGCNPFRDVRQILWLNLALGGQNGGSLAWTPRPLRYLIDYARVYQKIGTDGKATYLVDDKISEPTFNIKDGEEASVECIDAEKQGNQTNRKMIYNLQGINVGESEEDIHDSSQIYIVVDGNNVKKVKMTK